MTSSRCQTPGFTEVPLPAVSVRTGGFSWCCGNHANPGRNFGRQLGGIGIYRCLAVADALFAQDTLQAVIGNTQIFKLMATEQRGDTNGIFRYR